jgi:hypothetical protein
MDARSARTRGAHRYCVGRHVQPGRVGTNTYMVALAHARHTPPPLMPLPLVLFVLGAYHSGQTAAFVSIEPPTPGHPQSVTLRSATQAVTFVRHQLEGRYATMSTPHLPTPSYRVVSLESWN